MAGIRQIPKDNTRLLLLERKQSLFCEALGDPINRSSKEWRARDPNDGFSMNMSNGLWTNHKIDESGDILDFFAVFYLNLTSAKDDFPKVLEAANSYCGLTETTDFPQISRIKQSPITDQIPENEDVLEKLKEIENLSISLQKTLGEAYLVNRTIAKETLKQCSDVVQFVANKSNGGSIVAWATDDTRKPRGCQRIFLNSKGEKHPLGESKTAKLSFGSIAGFPVRLPASEGASKTLYITEGLETALTVREATNCETWAVLGYRNFKTAPIPKHHKVVLCPDRDAPDSHAAHGFSQAIKYHLRNGKAENLWIAEAIDEAVGSKADFNDTHQRLGLKDVQSSLKKAVRAKYWAIQQDLVPFYHDIPKDSLKDASKKTGHQLHIFEQEMLNPKVLETIEKHPRANVFQATTGIGKSHLTRQTVVKIINSLRAKGDDRKIVIILPRLNLAEEYLEKFRQINEADHLRIEIYRGREQQDPEALEKQMCRRFEEAFAIGKNGLSVSENLCRKADNTCPFYTTCGYRKQSYKTADIWLATQPLIYKRPPKFMKELAGLIIDEDPLTSCFRGFKGSGSSLYSSKLNLPLSENVSIEKIVDANAILEKLSRHCENSKGKFLNIADLSISKEDISVAIKIGRKCLSELGTTPISNKSDVLEATKRISLNNTRIIKVCRFLSIILETLELTNTENTYVSGIRIHPQEFEEGNSIKLLHFRWIKKIHKEWKVPTLVLSATINEDLIRYLIPDCKAVTKVNVKPSHTTIRQITNRAFSKTSLCEEGSKQLQSLSHYIQVRATESQTRCLVVAQKEVIERIIEYSNLPKNVVTTHFNNLTGMDTWTDVDIIIIIGRVDAKPNEVELRAEALALINVERIPREYPRRRAALTMSDGSIGPKVYAMQFDEDLLGTPYHPNLIAEEVRTHITNNELLQAMGRGRAIRRTAENPLKIDLLINIPLPIGIDEAGTFEDFKPSKENIMASRGLILENRNQKGCNPIIQAVLSDIYSNTESVRRDYLRRRPQEQEVNRSHASEFKGWHKARVTASRYTVDVCLKTNTEDEAKSFCDRLKITLISFNSELESKLEKPRIIQALERSNVIPLSAAEATRIFPDIWPNRDFAKNDKDLQSCREHAFENHTFKAPCLATLCQNTQMVLIKYYRKQGKIKHQHKAIVKLSSEPAINILTAVIGPLSEI